MRAIASVAVLFPALLAAQNEFEFTGRYWITQFGGSVRVEQAGFGTDIDVKRDLGIPDANFPAGGISWRHGRHRLSFLYTPIDYSGDQAVSRTLLFNGRQYTFGTRVVSNLEIRHLQLAWTWQFIDVKDGLVRLGPLVEADGFLMHGRLAAPDLSAPFTEQENVSTGLPTAGLSLEVRPHRRLTIYGNAAGITAGSYGYFVNSDTGVKLQTWKPVLLTAGYRTFNLHIQNAPDFANFRVRGPFVGAGLRF